MGCHFLLQCMKVKVKVKLLSRPPLFVTPWTAAHQAPPSMGFSKQEYWSGLSLPSPYPVLLLLLLLSHFSRVRLFWAPWTVACQAPLSLGFSRQDHWSGLPCPPPGDLPHPGTEPKSLMFPVLARGFFTTRTTWEAHGDSTEMP